MGQKNFQNDLQGSDKIYQLNLHIISYNMPFYKMFISYNVNYMILHNYNVFLCHFQNFIKFLLHLRIIYQDSNFSFSR